jgi:hypothetical protein
MTNEEWIEQALKNAPELTDERFEVTRRIIARSAARRAQKADIAKMNAAAVEP